MSIGEAALGVLPIGSTGVPTLLTKTASNTLTLSQSVVATNAFLLKRTGLLGTLNSVLGNIILDYQNVLVASASNTIVFSESTSSFNPFPKISQSLTFISSVSVAQGIKPAANTLVFTQVASTNVVYHRPASNTLTFLQVADNGHIRAASNTLTFSQSATLTQLKGASNTLTITEMLARTFTHSDSASNTLVIVQTVGAAFAYPRSVSNTITFSQSAIGRRVRFLTASNLFVMSQISAPTKIVLPSNTITISGAATQFRVINRRASNTLQLAQSMNRNMAYGLQTSSVLTFNNYFIKATSIDPSWDNTVVPGGTAGGGTSNAYVGVPIPHVMVTKVNSSVVYGVQNRALVLLRPELGDSEAGLSKMIMQRTITGATYTYTRKNQRRKLKYSFLVDRNKALETRRFFLDYFSTPMTMTNFKGEIWVGFASQPEFESIAKDRGGSCGEQFTFDIEFEGTRIH